MVATDSPFNMNIELVRLSKAILGEEGRNLEIATVVYDDLHKVDPKLSLKKIEESDAVIFEDPLPQVPAFTNVRAADYLRHAEATKRRVYRGSDAGMLVYARE